MSRIIHQKFTVEFNQEDTYVPDDNIPATRSHATSETRIRVYALNYNILSFDSGLAGLKFF
jgi:hypothetical protein